MPPDLSTRWHFPCGLGFAESGLGYTVVEWIPLSVTSGLCYGALSVALGKLDRVSVMEERCPSEVVMVLGAGSLR